MSVLAPAYRPRRPTETVLYAVVSQHLETFLAHARETYETPLPRYVEEELRGYLRCGDFLRGFVHCRCETCGHDLVAFSGRGLLFRRLLEQAVVTGPVTEGDVTGGHDWLTRPYTASRRHVMNFRDSMRFVAGATATYIVMAACGGGDSGQATDAGKAGDSASDGHRHIFDALTDPVAEAKASDDSSGTRLKVQRTVGADGSSLVTGLYDSMLKITCAYVRASDGSVRCLPAGYGTVAGLGPGGATFFSDASCKMPVAYIPDSGCSPAYAAETVAAACASNTTIYPIVKSYTGTLYQLGTTCAGVSRQSGWSYYVIGAAMPPSDFVGGTTMTDP